MPPSRSDAEAKLQIEQLVERYAPTLEAHSRPKGQPA